MYLQKIARDGPDMPKEDFLGVLPKMTSVVMWVRTCGLMQKTGLTSIDTVSVSVDGVIIVFWNHLMPRK
jgi:hypothetical protein